MEKKLKVGILGATGMVGQRFISLLENHPWFEVVTVAASPRSAGKTYEEAVGDRWKMTTPMPEAVKKLVVMNVNDVEHVASTVDFVFSAVDMTKEEIKAIEEEYAKTETPVVSNNSAHRWTPDVPMVVPEINSEHFDVIKDQKKRLGTTRGFIAVKPNCSIQSYAPCLAAWKEFGPKEVVATTYQAISGAGKTFKDWPEMVENIIPYIGGEEEKSEQEPLRVLGKVENGEIVKAQLPKITCQCLRVPVLNGHTAAVFINFEKKPTKEQLIEKLVSFKGFPQEENLPSAPKQFIQYLEEDNRPQVKLDVDYENGMGVSIGRLREDSMFDFKFVGLSHNTVRGAAGGAGFAAIVFGILFFFPIKNPTLFIVINGICYLGASGFQVLIWAMVNDAIDYQELTTGDRKEGMVYATYSFFRKLASAVSSSLSSFTLALIGYNVNEAVQTAAVKAHIWKSYTAIYAIGYLIAVLILYFVYPLSKKKTEEMLETLAKKRAKQGE